MPLREMTNLIDTNHTPEDMEDYKRCLSSFNWRLCNLYYIKDKDGKRVKFLPNHAQRKLLKDKHNRNVILKARQLGFTTLIQIYFLDCCLFTPHTNAGVIAHTRDDAEAFFTDKIRFAYDNLPKHLKDALPAKTDSVRELRFENGSVIRVGTSLRGGTNQKLHISELGKLAAKSPQKATEVKTGALPTVPNDGEIFVESTAEGRSGWFYNLCDVSQKNEPETSLDFKFHFFPWFDDENYSLDYHAYISEELHIYFMEVEQYWSVKLTDGQKAWYVKMSQSQGEEMKREFPSTPEEAFEAAVEGAYFARQMAQIRAKNQIINVPIVPGIPIHTFWDLGRDTTPIIFFQKVGFDYRFVDYFENSGEGMDYYLGVLADRKDGDEKYLYGDMYLPHDGTRRGLSAEFSPAEKLHNAGYSVRVVQRTPAKDNSIEAARNVLPLCYFDKNKCSLLIDRLDNYRKEWDDKLGTWKKVPLHDINSHGADAFMTFADGFRLDEEKEDDGRARDQHDGTRNPHTGY